MAPTSKPSAGISSKGHFSGSRPTRRDDRRRERTTALRRATVGARTLSFVLGGFVERKHRPLIRIVSLKRVSVTYSVCLPGRGWQCYVCPCMFCYNCFSNLFTFLVGSSRTTPERRSLSQPHVVRAVRSAVAFSPCVSSTRQPPRPDSPRHDRYHARDSRFIAGKGKLTSASTARRSLSCLPS
jgi:hypothetical protein